MPATLRVPQTPPTLAALVDAAEEAGDVDLRAVARALGVASGAVRALLARPWTLERARLDALAGALGMDRRALRALVAREAPEEETPEPAAATITGALAALVGAIDDATPWGRAARRAVLDVAERAARAAGRPVPAELHALRARIARDDADAPLVAPAAEPPPPPETRPPRHRLPEADVALLDAAAAAIRTLQESGVGYDALFSPLHDEGLAQLLLRFGLAVREAPLGTTSAAVVTPPLYGRGVALVSADASRDQRRLALRRALAHAATGQVAEGAPLAVPEPWPVERLADVVALADLLPYWQLADARPGVRIGWRALTDDVARQAASLAGDWTWARILDRATLRVALFRRTGL